MIERDYFIRHQGENETGQQFYGRVLPRNFLAAGAASTALNDERNERNKFIPAERSLAEHTVRTAVDIREQSAALLVSENDNIQKAAYRKTEDKKPDVDKDAHDFILRAYYKNFVAGTRTNRNSNSGWQGALIAAV